MASHSLITLPTPITPEDVERAVEGINQRRFQGRLVLQEMTVDWMHAARGWALIAPGTKPKPSKIDPEPEDLGFSFWLHEGGGGIEIRHIILQSWLRWVQDVFKHELAKHYGVRRFDGGDGSVQTDPAQYKTSLYEFATRNLREPLSDDAADFIRQHFTNYIPEGWA